MSRDARSPRGKELATLAAELASDKGAEEIELFDLRRKSAPAEWVVICGGNNIVHNRAIAESILKGVEEREGRVWHVEGAGESRWILLDYVDVVVHVMLPEVREYYGLDAIWRETERRGTEGEGNGK